MSKANDAVTSPVERVVIPEPAPCNNLPDWSECSIRVDNEKYLEDSGIEDDGDTLLPNELHRFIYEYDDADPYKSAWFLHRLEKLIKFVKSNPEEV